MRLVGRGFNQERWRADFEKWAEKRIWAERFVDHLAARLEHYVIGHNRWQDLTVLDLGTGRGGLSVMLRAGGAWVVAVDLRSRNCRVTKLRASRYGMDIAALNAVGEALPFRPASFDLVICRDVTEHCRDPFRVLTEIRRVLKPKGCAYVTFTNRLAWDDPHYHLKGVNFLPRFLGEAAVKLFQRSKQDSRDMQRLSDMHYYTLRGARRVSHRAGLSYRDLTRRRMKANEAGAFRLLAHDALSLGRSTFEAVLQPRPVD
jgi:2-polyprenyl-3-methyl-5-hydroxy-6-metoxy-1,4-benzoquinol methylase